MRIFHPKSFSGRSWDDGAWLPDCPGADGAFKRGCVDYGAGWMAALDIFSLESVRGNRPVDNKQRHGSAGFRLKAQFFYPGAQLAKYGTDSAVLGIVVPPPPWMGT